MKVNNQTLKRFEIQLKDIQLHFSLTSWSDFVRLYTPEISGIQSLRENPQYYTTNTDSLHCVIFPEEIILLTMC